MWVNHMRNGKQKGMLLAQLFWICIFQYISTNLIWAIFLRISTYNFGKIYVDNPQTPKTLTTNIKIKRHKLVFII